jgi:phage shock protein A
MWKRFRRAMRSFFGFFVTSIEDPELILEQNIRDLNDQVPRMNSPSPWCRRTRLCWKRENVAHHGVGTTSPPR